MRRDWPGYRPPLQQPSDRDYLRAIVVLLFAGVSFFALVLLGCFQ